MELCPISLDIVMEYLLMRILSSGQLRARDREGNKIETKFGCRHPVHHRNKFESQGQDSSMLEKLSEHFWYWTKIDLYDVGVEYDTVQRSSSNGES